MDSSTELERLKALLSDPPYVNFQADMEAAESQIGLYLELQRARGMPSSEELEASHSDLFWVARSAVVTSFSALDRLIHALLQQRLSQEEFKRVRFKTFQSAGQVDKAMQLIGVPDIYQSVHKKYSKDLMTSEQLRSTLDSYYDRKNRITHHSDSNDHGQRAKLPAYYAHECCKFIGEFGGGLHATVFGI